MPNCNVAELDILIPNSRYLIISNGIVLDISLNSLIIKSFPLLGSAMDCI